MAAYATSTDLQSRWRALTTAEQSQATTLLGDASTWIRAWIPSVDERITAGLLDSELVKIVACSMVKRAMLGLGHEGQASHQHTETMGPFTETENAVFRNPDGNLYLTRDEFDLLDGRPSGAVSMECEGL